MAMTRSSRLIISALGGLLLASACVVGDEPPPGEDAEIVDLRDKAYSYDCHAPLIDVYGNDAYDYWMHYVMDHMNRAIIGVAGAAVCRYAPLARWHVFAHQICLAAARGHAYDDELLGVTACELAEAMTLAEEYAALLVVEAEALRYEVDVEAARVGQYMLENGISYATQAVSSWYFNAMMAISAWYAPSPSVSYSYEIYLEGVNIGGGGCNGEGDCWE